MYDILRMDALIFQRAKQANACQSRRRICFNKNFSKIKRTVEKALYKRKKKIITKCKYTSRMWKGVFSRSSKKRVSRNGKDLEPPLPALCTAASLGSFSSYCSWYVYMRSDMKQARCCARPRRIISDLFVQRRYTGPGWIPARKVE